jgi:hypothetical protein
MRAVLFVDRIEEASHKVVMLIFLFAHRQELQSFLGTRFLL